ncbi:MAG: TIGR01177 family methyltransferase [Methanomicrobiales archaeon]
MEIYLILSRENITLPRSEVLAVLESEKINYQIKNEFSGILHLAIPDDENCIQILEKRLGYVHEIVEMLFDADMGNLYNKFESVHWSDYIKDTYVVRVKKINSKHVINSPEVEKDLGTIIKNSLKEEAVVNLENPETFIRVTFVDDAILVGLRRALIDKKHFFNLKPHKRPFFYPGSMSPKLARCMVNLSRVKKGDTVFDPFCGTGGILIEAGIIGARILGSDIDEKMVKGTIENLQHCGIKDFNIIQGDARRIKLDRRVDSIVTDPPYGISASTAGEESKKLYKESIQNMQELIKKEGYVCLATPHYVDVTELISNTKFKIIERHEIRMHKSLTRVITVLKNA